MSIWTKVGFVVLVGTLSMGCAATQPHPESALLGRPDFKSGASEGLDEDVQSQLDEASAAYHKGDLAGAAKGFTELASLRPRAVGPVAILASISFKQGDLSGFVHYQQNVLSLAPDRPVVRRSLVAALMKLDRLADAGDVAAKAPNPGERANLVKIVDSYNKARQVGVVNTDPNE